MSAQLAGMGVPDALNRRNAAIRKGLSVRRDHPATAAQKLYDDDESDYLKALDRFRTRTGTRFPTAVEMLAVAREVGYVRLPPGTRLVEMGPQQLLALADTVVAAGPPAPGRPGRAGGMFTTPRKMCIIRARSRPE